MGVPVITGEANGSARRGEALARRQTFVSVNEGTEIVDRRLRFAMYFSQGTRFRP